MAETYAQAVARQARLRAKADAYARSLSAGPVAPAPDATRPETLHLASDTWLRCALAQYLTHQPVAQASGSAGYAAGQAHVLWCLETEARRRGME